MLRGLAVPPRDHAQLIAAAQRVIGYYQTQEVLDAAERLHGEEEALPLMAAARTLYAVALDMRRQGKEPDDVRSLLLLSACAYAMYGNFPSACAVLSDPEVASQLSELEIVAVSICMPQLAAKNYANLDDQASTRAFLQGLVVFITEGVEPIAPLVGQLEALMVGQASIAERVYLRCARLALKQLQHLSLSRYIIAVAVQFLFGLFKG